MTRTLKWWLGGTAVATSVAMAGFVWAGVYNVAADAPHTQPVYKLLDTVRERSVQARASRLSPPADLASEARIRQGAGNYEAMCVGCHLAPGMDATELSRGLYPAPPNLSRETVDAAEAFWTIKHGIKASGMPAWGHSMPDEYIWNLAAFVRAMPKLDAAQYRALVDSSDGHSHGGGETKPHGKHEHADSDDHHSDGKGEAHPPTPPASEHRHADGRTHVHDAAAKDPKPTAPEAPAPAHDHSHGHAH